MKYYVILLPGLSEENPEIQYDQKFAKDFTDFYQNFLASDGEGNVVNKYVYSPIPEYSFV